MKRYLKVLGMTLVFLVFVLSFVIIPYSEAFGLKSQILGKWFEKDGTTVEFFKEGTVTIGSGVGDYKFIDDNHIRMDIKSMFGQGAMVFEVSMDKEGALILKEPTGKVSKLLTEKAYNIYMAKVEAERKKLEAQRKAEEEKKRRAEAEKIRKVEEELKLPLEKRMVFVKGGCFQMGDTFGDGDSEEKPVHEVCVDDFYMAKYEVTQKEWTAIMGNNPSEFENCDTCPVEQVSWNDAQEFINKLNEKTTPSVPLDKGGLKDSPLTKGGRGLYRLPTEAEWEYAARSGGKKEKYSGGNNLDSVGWYNENSGKKTHPVGQKAPNGLGLYDMTGNVWEWVNDWYDEDYYKSSPKNNPTGANSGQKRVFRGGSWGNNPRNTRAAYRNWNYPFVRDYLSYGFRCAMTK